MRCTEKIFAFLFLLASIQVLSGCNDVAPQERDVRQRAIALNDSAMIMLEEVILRQTEYSYADVLSLLDQAIAVDSTYRGAYSNKASVLQHVGHNQEAAAVLRQWLKNHPEDTSVRTTLAIILGMGGNIQAANRQLEIVLKERNQQIESYPDSTDLYVERAFVKLMQGRQKEAVAELDSLVEANPESRGIKLIYDIAVGSDKEEIAEAYLGQ